ncbi:MAG: septum formation protein Maf [Hyphomicrobiales bacterium]|nr:septum formation protein Maf [Hyphomicrobiales bacterium]
MAAIILASQSPTRAALLKAAAIDFDVIPPDVNERMVEAPFVAAGKSSTDIALALAEAKARAIADRYPDAWIIGADQVLDLEGDRWSKPESLEAARKQLGRLAGRTHTLRTAVFGVRGKNVRWHHCASPALTMRALSGHEIDAYLATVGEAALGSVGAYQIEGPGIQLFERIEGDYFAILGLPLLPVLNWLRAEGAIG